LLAVLVVGVSAGCAGDEALSRDEYVSRLNAMCLAFSEKEKEIGEPQSLPELVENGPRILDAFQETIVDQVRTLKAPSEIDDQADRLVDLAIRQHDVLAGLVDAAKAKDVARVVELTSRNEELNQKTRSITLELGAKACAEN
jgi:hypothetical protein